MLCKGNFEKTNLTKEQLRNRVNEKWALWRLVLSDMNLDYNTVFNQMTPKEIDEANMALDIYIEMMNKKRK